MARCREERAKAHETPIIERTIRRQKQENKSAWGTYLWTENQQLTCTQLKSRKKLHISVSTPKSAFVACYIGTVQRFLYVISDVHLMCRLRWDMLPLRRDEHSHSRSFNSEIEENRNESTWIIHKMTSHDRIYVFANLLIRTGHANSSTA